MNDILVLKKGEELVSSLINYCTEKDIKSAAVFAIGAISSATLAQYDLKTKQYNNKKYEGAFEIAALQGNIGLLDGKIVSHLHAVISDNSMTPFAGHLDRAVVAATCEITILRLDHQITRVHNPKIGLNLINK